MKLGTLVEFSILKIIKLKKKISEVTCPGKRIFNFHCQIFSKVHRSETSQDRYEKNYIFEKLTFCAIRKKYSPENFSQNIFHGDENSRKICGKTTETIFFFYLFFKSLLNKLKFKTSLKRCSPRVLEL